MVEIIFFLTNQNVQYFYVTRILEQELRKFLWHSCLFLYFYQGLDPFILKVLPWKHVFPFHCERHVCDEPDESYSQPAAQFSSLSSSNDHQSPILVKHPIFTKRAQSGRVLFFRILFRHCWRAQLSSWRGWFRSGGHQSLARTKKCQELLLHKNIFENHLCSTKKNNKK